MIEAAGRLRDAAIDFSGFATPEEIVVNSARSFLAYLGRDLTTAEAEALTDEILLNLESSGWSLSGLLNREIFAVPACAADVFIRDCVGFDPDDPRCSPQSTVKAKTAWRGSWLDWLFRAQP